MSAGISGPAASSLFAFGPSVLEFDGTNNVGVFSSNGGTVNIGNPGTFNNTIFNTSGKTVIGSNAGTAPAGATVVNWNAYGAFSGGSFFGIADAKVGGENATLNFNGGTLGVSNVTVFIGNGSGSGQSGNGTFNMNNGTVTIDSSNGVDISGLGTGSTLREPAR